MHHNTAFVKKTKKGKVLKVVREHYLRDDIWSGSPLDAECDPTSHKLSATAEHYLLIDTNVALHQIDFLEHASVTDVIVCSVVLEEVQHKNQAAYQRLRALVAAPDRRFFAFSNEHHRDTYVTAQPGESPNDRNDRAIRVAAKWYAARLPDMKVILLSNDADNRHRAQAEGLTALSVVQYVKQRPDAAELEDLVAGRQEMAEEDGPAKESTSDAKGRPVKRKKMYSEHLGFSEVQMGIKAGRLHQGSLRVGRFNPFEGYVGSDSVGQEILISGRVDMNRALDGDIVAVELLPEDQWKAPASSLPGGRKGSASGSAPPTPAGVHSDDEEGLGDDDGPAEIFQVAPGEHFDAGAASRGSGERQPTGRVVGIIKRNWRTRGYCGALKPPDASRAGRGSASTSSVLFVPVERKYPMVRIQTRQADTLMDKRMVVAIDGWEADSMYPSGHYVRTLGTIGDRDTETEVILIENDVNTSPFTPAVHACVPPLPWLVTQADLEEPGRRDLRETVLCSVDPPGCKDIDDALHVRELPNGNLEVGVHIADVTHFLRPSTAMDTEASARATSVYLVQRRIDMLPKPLTEDICSLRANVERLAFSVLWEMTQDVEVVSVSFTKSIIRSNAALTYQEAQARIDDERLSDDLTLSLRTMNRIAKVLRRRRAERGALQLASPEVKFVIDSETHDPLDVGMYQVREANQMVEELMLLANIAVAEKISRHFPACSLLRRHAEPAPRQFDPIMKAAAAAGFVIDASTSKALAASLDEAVRPGDPYFNKLVRIMCTRCMTQALYFGSGELGVSEYHHYGLAAPIYTHFTSPIRRYADVVVHRLLSAALGLEALPDNARDRASLHECSGNLNVRHHGAQMAGRASVELHTLIFFNKRVVIADGRVVKVKANGLIVFVPKYGIEGPVYLCAKAPVAKPGATPAVVAKMKAAADAAAAAAAAAAPGTSASSAEWVLDEERQVVCLADGSGTSYGLFDRVAVQISVEETFGHRRQLALALVDRDKVPESERVN